MLTKDFVLGGYAIFTVKPSEAYIKANGGQDHYTYRIEIKEVMEVGQRRLLFRF